MARKTMVLLVFLASPLFSIGQQITNSYINPGYGILNNKISLTWSIGDLFYGELSGQELLVDGMVFSVKKEKPTGIPEPFRNGISLYPNPCRSVLFIRTEIRDPLIYRLVTTNGIILANDNISENNSIDLSDIPEGVYIIQISDIPLTFYYSCKLIKAH